MELPRVTLDEFLKFEPCWLDDEQGRRRLRYYARKLGGSADALEILALRRIPADERLWVVLREEFIPAPILNECACRCAIDGPDSRSIHAIVVKRRWIAGEATDAELAAARAAADAAARAAADAAARAAAWAAAWAAARAAARAAAWAAAEAAQTATWAAAETARNAQVDMLTQILREYVVGEI